MDFQLSEDQAALVSALQTILQDHADIPQDRRFDFFWHDADLQAQLEANGFLDAARDMGPVEAALVIFETAQLVTTVDTLGRGMVAPLALPDRSFDRPVALTEIGHLDRGIRNLPISGALLIADGDDVLELAVEPDNVEPIESVLGFPYGRFRTAPDLASATRHPGAAGEMRRLWRVGLAAEIAGASRAAIDFTIDYVKQREVFGTPVGSFQSVQHRLVRRHGFARSLYYLTLKAAWSGAEVDAAIAACHAQSGLRELMFDLHQFNGGMGMTTEHLLHFWLYRARALQGECGGPTRAALDIADQRWGAAADVTAGQSETVSA